jgi:MFS family permease
MAHAESWFRLTLSSLSGFFPTIIKSLGYTVRIVKTD